MSDFAEMRVGAQGVRARFALTRASQLGLLFFFSGFAALIYQLIWQRSLFRVLGVNIEAVTIVVTAFMVGLGLGSLAGGALSKRIGDRVMPLLAVIETATGVFGLFSLAIFDSIGAMAIGAPLVVTALVALLLVLVPTLLMGATLPILVAHVARASGLTGQSVGYLYFVNTIGAATACLAGALVIFPFLGMSASVFLAVAINAGVALFALRLHLTRDKGPLNSAVVADAKPVVGAPGRALLSFNAMLLLGAVGGFVSLSYEIFLVRIMSFATGGLAYAFAVTLGCFLVGIASGSRVAGDLHGFAPAQQANRIRNELGFALLAGLLCLPALLWLGLSRPLLLGLVLACAYVIARAWGMLLPYLAEQGIAADEDTGAKVSWLYLANIVGAAAGSILTGFVMMNALDLVGIGQALAGLSLVAIVIFVAATGSNWRSPGFLTGAVFAVAGCLALPHLSAGIYDRLLYKADAFVAPAVTEIVENRSGVIAVTADGIVYGNGMYDGRFNTDLVDDSNDVIRPFAISLLHPAPKKVLMIGLSGGAWARIIASHPQVESLKVIEINPGYPELASRHPQTASILNDPKISFVYDDGRRWLRSRSGEKFDVIVSNTTFNFRANITSLLSREFLELVTSRLAPGGVFFYNTTMSDRVQRTGCVALPHGLRFTNHMALARDPFAIDFARWRQTLIDYRIDGKPVLDLANPQHVLKLDELMAYAKDWRQGRGLEGAIETCDSVLKRTQGRAIVTDDNMGTEWRTPLGLD